MEAVLAASETMELAELVQASKKCSLTGYCADAVFADHAPAVMPLPSLIRKWYEDAWEKDLEKTLNDNESIDETLIANEYEFWEGGNKF